MEGQKCHEAPFYCLNTTVLYYMTVACHYSFVVNILYTMIANQKSPNVLNEFVGFARRQAASRLRKLSVAPHMLAHQAR